MVEITRTDLPSSHSANTVEKQYLQNRAELMMQKFVFVACIIARAIGAFGFYANWDSGPSRKLKRGDRTVRVYVICGRSTNYMEPLLLYSAMCVISGYFVFLRLKEFMRRSRLE